MEYKIDTLKEILKAEVVKKLGNLEYLVKINGEEKNLKVLNLDSRGIEFVLDNQYHKAKYLKNSVSKIDLVIDNTPITLTTNTHLDEIVYKNSGGGGAVDTQSSLRSQIPGKVVSIAAEEGSSVKKGDTVCVLESMKMQVSVKSHKDGTVKSIKIKPGASVAKNDLIAEID